ncbi:MAG: glycosyltransferase family 2 protein [candidate division Zixibacteria bacterium]|nr:glycosyltransferase family 2 protein [candidate division Zixibacteria bacterium]
MNKEEIKNSVVSTIIPALNEEGNIDELCKQFDEMQKKADFKSELVIIDDGSTDNTLQKIKENAKKYNFIRYASHQHNRGLTEALQTGFSTASGEIYVFYPADLQYKPEDIPALVQPIFEGADFSTGWKQGKYEKWFVSQIYNWISRKIFNLKVHDLNSVKAFRKEILKRIFLRKDWHRYLVVLATAEGFQVDEVKIPLYSRNWGTTKFSFWRIPIGVLDMLAVKFQITFLRKPLLFFGVLGSIMIFLGSLVGLWSIYLKYFHAETQLPLLYLVILLIGTGLGLFMMGFLSEGQAAVKEELGDMRQKIQALLDEQRKNINRD